MVIDAIVLAVLGSIDALLTSVIADNLTRTQHTGLFLDQRDSRRRVVKFAAGARVANLFAFTCSFSVAAAAAAVQGAGRRAAGISGPSARDRRCRRPAPR